MRWRFWKRPPPRRIPRRPVPEDWHMDSGYQPVLSAERKIVHIEPSEYDPNPKVCALHGGFWKVVFDDGGQTYLFGDAITIRLIGGPAKKKE